MTDSYDAIVLGLGAMGSAAAYHIARRGHTVLGLDQFAPPHDRGSSHGGSRITRRALGEGAEFVPFVMRSDELWDELERETGQTLVTRCGGLVLVNGENYARHGSRFFDQTVACARQFNIPHALLEAAEIRRRFPQFKLNGSEQGYFEPQAGWLRPEACVRAQLQLAARHGAALHLNERVLKVEPAGSGVRLTTTQGAYSAARLILAAGPWVGDFIDPAFRPSFAIYRQVMVWFDCLEPAAYQSENCPVYIWEFNSQPEESLYGFPALDGPRGGVKIASEERQAAGPDTAAREVSAAETRGLFDRLVAPHFRGLSPRVVQAVTCLYTSTPDSKFVIDFDPRQPQIVIASPCSGHGFKHSAAIGETLAELALDGRSRLDISPFSLGRLAAPPAG